MPKSRILVVDDEARIRQVIQFKLERMGYDIITATTGAAGFKKAKECMPDLIITDYEMPGEMDGLKLIATIRETESIAKVPVIMLSGSVAISTVFEELFGGISNVTLLQKPFSPRAFAKIVEKILND